MAQQPQRSETIMLPPGRYFLGDPCLAIHQDSWPAFLQSFSARNTASTMDGHKSAVFGAFGGDGLRHDAQGQPYEVESGLIAALPQDLITKNPAGLDEGWNGRMLSFDEPFECWSELVHGKDSPNYKNGRDVHIGHVIIHT